MKKIISSLILSLMLVLGTVTADPGSQWAKYVAADQSYSFHYPSGWTVSLDDSMVGFESSITDEEFMMLAIPFDQSKSPQELANGFVAMLKNANPNLRASNWRSKPESAGTLITFDLANQENSKAYSGFGLVIKSQQQAMWYSYFAPAADYHQVRGYNIMQGFIGSMAPGTASEAPKIDYSVKRAEQIERNSKAFMFVLEFALGAPFTHSQEAVILDELKDGWRYLSPEGLQKYDQYPIVMQNILKMGQKDLETLRADLEKTIRQWLVETNQSDPAVKIINMQLKNKGSVVIEGTPPLTEMSLTAYSEIIAYSRLLQQDPKAKPEQITQESVNEVKQQVKAVWKSFSITDKKDIATTPGLWVCLRVQLQSGTQAEQDKIRENLKKLEAATHDIAANNGTSPTANGSTGAGTQKPMSMTTHWCMQQIQQQTFNTYMWSRGFNYLPATGKMW